MDIFKKKVIRNSAILIAVFASGMIFGYQLDNNAITWIQGFSYSLMSGSATDSNATDSNATDSNATSSNATSSNATSSNATSSNATSPNVVNPSVTTPGVQNPNELNTDVQPSGGETITNPDNVLSNENVDGTGTVTENSIYNQCLASSNMATYITIETLDVPSEEFIAGETVYFTMVTSGACYNGGTIVFSNDNNEFSVDVKQDFKGNYFEVPADIGVGIYHIDTIKLNGMNSNNEAVSLYVSFEELASINAGESTTQLNIVEKEVEEADDNIVSFQKSNMVNILLIVLGLGFVIALVIIVVLLTRRNKLSDKQ